MAIVNWDIFTALHIAADGGYRDLVKILLDAGASTTDETKEGNTPVHIAARNGFVELLSDFAQHGVNMRMVNRKRSCEILIHISRFGKNNWQK